MRSVTMLGFIIIGKCVNNEMILSLNEYNLLVIIIGICIFADLRDFTRNTNKRKTKKVVLTFEDWIKKHKCEKTLNGKMYIKNGHSYYEEELKRWHKAEFDW